MTHPADRRIVSGLRRIRRLIPVSVRRRLRRLLFAWLDLNWRIPTTGVDVRLPHYGDWVVYNEIFVTGEYDDGIRRALDATPQGAAFRVLDVGANTGLFTLRVVDQARRRGLDDTDISILAVEGNAPSVEEFRERVFRTNGLASQVTVLHGLVGDRSGAAILHRDHLQISSTTHPAVIGTADRAPGHSPTVPYVDLSRVLAAWPEIALLKCDIEGSEERFIETYPDLFAKVRVAVFEFHRQMCDTDRCLALLREYGFTHQVTLRPGDPYFTVCVWR